MSAWLPLLAKTGYFIAAALFIFGLKRMASPVTARSGIQWAGVGMVIATVAALLTLTPDPQALLGVKNLELILAGIAVGGVLAWVSGKRVAITDMPQMVALYNGLGGGAAAAIGAVELAKFSTGGAPSPGMTVLVLATLGALIGSVALTGSIIAWAKLDGRLDRRFVFPGQQLFNAAIGLLAVGLGAATVLWLQQPVIVGFFVTALVLGVLMTLPIGGADMPVVISLYNALTGLAVAFEGYVLQNEALIIAGTVVGAAGTMLTRLMAKAMNRSLFSVLFGSFGAGGGVAAEIDGAQKPIDAGDVASMMGYAERVVIVPGYGMAVAQAQHKIWELAQQLMARGVKVKFAIHPVAGRMPGHMNVLLAEAGVPYDLIADMDDVNPEFPNTDVSLVIGANDVVNPVAKTDPASPIYGMPILDVSRSKNTVVIKRGKGTGFAGIENALFYADNTRMLYGDGAEMANQLVAEVKALDGGH
ncbi:NAD(P)(+) transhydrogenase (Re/Si-specific) subunit beta [Alkalisalibacterium limincola]|uniref:NAD(P) transhydrogenase subunit beta n=1 Tax=Alkalisalibacterium limincola TaxID=2699169 RepID=A0A5C8KWU2_9GAMM|nr:NAD(P)(+) transhydrogenase (Re/Si-specific) subunit beta [Alkalisalibacterium limincola]TXK65130.1 NAD(P)(+) transhydrogenase (Re/Si-specific) subunit beta [Alkalisalibacterium limincola]